MTVDRAKGRNSLAHRSALRHTLALVAALFASLVHAQARVEFSFYYPVVVGGPITQIMDRYAAEFEAEHPHIHVRPIYTGGYQESMIKALTAARSGEPPATAILLSTEMHTLIDEDAIVPFDDVTRTDDDKAWLRAFDPVFMENSRADGRTWGIPFQRSTIVLYWNKDIFRAAGLDPERPPQDWREQLEFARRLTARDASGKVTRWGIQIPSSVTPYWLFQALVIQNGTQLMNEAGTRTYFDTPEAIAALHYWVDLSLKYRVHPAGIVDLGATPRDFLERKVAMMWTTSGNLANIRNNAKFEFGVAMLPAGTRRGTPTGGGNFYLFRSTTAQQREAAVTFIKWMTTPQRAARWSIETGYIAVRPDAWETPALKQHLASFPPAGIARDQLRYARAELATHDYERVAKVLDDGLQAALTGSKTPEQALKDAQREADRLLQRSR